MLSEVEPSETGQIGRQTPKFSDVGICPELFFGFGFGLLLGFLSSAAVGVDSVERFAAAVTLGPAVRYEGPLR